MNVTIKILGIPLYVGNIDSITSFLLYKQNQTKENRLISATGAHGMVFSKKNEDFKQILHQFYLNLPDGMPGVLFGKLKGANGMNRCYGPDFFKSVMIQSSQTNVTHFLCGGKEGVAERLSGVCQESFGAKISGVYCPPFLSVKEYDYKKIAEKINLSKASIVWIGLSSPKQEQFAFNLSRYTNVDYICSVGAAFDFHIGNVKQAPKWVQNISMEWFFRLMMEPKRLWKRYFEIVPLFLYYNLTELLSGNFFKNK